MGGRGWILNFFFLGGVAFLIAGFIAFSQGGDGGKIASITFFLLGGIWVVVSLLVGRVYQAMAAGRQKELALFHNGTRAVAIIESVQTTGTVLNNINVRIILRLRVKPPYGTEFEHVRKLFVPTFAVPRPGDVINVAYDPNDLNKVALEFNPASNTAGGIQLITRSPGGPAMSAGLMSPSQISPPLAVPSMFPTPIPGTQSRPAPTAATSELDALERLATLHKSGALTDVEFEEQKRKIIYGR